MHGGRRCNQTSSATTLALVLDFLRGSWGCGGLEVTLATLRGWTWFGREGVSIGWNLPMDQWEMLIDNTAPLTESLNRHWATLGRKNTWQPSWKAMWAGWSLARAWLIIWRVLQHAYYTNARGEIWGLHKMRVPLVIFRGRILTICSLSVLWLDESG